MQISRYLFAALIALALPRAASACADPPRASFREIVSTAPTIFTFQVTSAYFIHKPLGDLAYTEYVVGNIRVVESLKGDASSFKLIKYSFRSCGSTRISVGQFYLAATSQTGPLLQLWGMDEAVLDLTLDFYQERTKSSPAVDIVKQIIGGSHVPADFPRADLETPLEVYPAPPPPELRK
jgi:hypothetical protein